MSSNNTPYFSANIKHLPREVVVLPSPHQVPQTFLHEVTWRVAPAASGRTALPIFATR
jgi:hypothetical protein